MFRTTVNNTKLRVSFAHTVDTKKARRITVCRVFNDETKDEMAMGLSICSRKDQFCKAEGRKRSLTNAVRRLYLVDKAARSTVWTAYFKSADGKLQ